MTPKVVPTLPGRVVAGHVSAPTDEPDPRSTGDFSEALSRSLAQRSAGKIGGGEARHGAPERGISRDGPNTEQLGKSQGRLASVSARSEAGATSASQVEDCNLDSWSPAVNERGRVDIPSVASVPIDFAALMLRVQSGEPASTGEAREDDPERDRDGLQQTGTRFAAASLATAEDVPTVRVTHQETHFAPVSPERTPQRADIEQHRVGSWPSALTGEPHHPGSVAEHAVAKSEVVRTVRVAHQEASLAPVPAERMQTEASFEQRAAAVRQPSVTADQDHPGSVAEPAVASPGRQWSAEAVTPPAVAEVQAGASWPVASVTGQIAESLLSEASATDRLRASEPPGAIPVQSLRMLKLQLAPESLGVIDVVLEKRGVELSVRLEPAVVEVAEHLEADKASLSDRILASGYELTELVIAGASKAPEPSPSPSREATPSTPSRAAGGSDTADRNGQGGKHDQREPGAQAGGRPAADRGGNEATTAAPGAGRFLGSRTLRSI